MRIMNLVLAIATTLMTITFGFAQAKAADRDWSINPTSLLLLTLNERLEPTQQGVKSQDVTEQNAVIEFGRNWGQLEAGPIFNYSLYKDDYYKNTATSFGAYFRFNFVENKTGEMLVPFARISYTGGDLKYETTGSPSRTTRTNDLRIRGGVTWFPVNDFVAIEGFLDYREQQYRPETNDYKYSGLALNGAFVVYF
jgi:hypothetical protein